MEDKLILLKRINPTEFEVHRNEIDRTRNLLFTTTDGDFAEKVVNRYNSVITGKDIGNYFDRIFEEQIKKIK